MPAVTLSPSDLTPFAEIDVAKAMAMIDDAMALAARVAPCILTDEFEFGAAARAVLRGAILRWHEAGTGALSQKAQNRGPFGSSETYDTRQTRKGMFWPSEIQQLQDLCRSDVSSSGAFGLDTVSGVVSYHADICSLNFGALYCSCGAVLTGAGPLYEV